jgi:PAB-dependent poly(A)-specific ribonuclease subunit 2
MPYYREPLLSVWPNTICELGQLPPSIAPEILSNATRGEMGYYAPNKAKKWANQVDYTRPEENVTKTIVAPKFLSEKARDATHAQEGDRGFSDALSDLKLDGTARKDVPHIYRNVEIKYSQFGVDDFDFECVFPNPFE